MKKDFLRLNDGKEYEFVWQRRKYTTTHKIIGCSK